jgi:hypothetical protein
LKIAASFQALFKNFSWKYTTRRKQICWKLELSCAVILLTSVWNMLSSLPQPPLSSTKGRETPEDLASEPSCARFLQIDPYRHEERRSRVGVSALANAPSQTPNLTRNNNHGTLEVLHQVKTDEEKSR